MPAKSKAQARFMGAVIGGAIKKKGLSKEKAKEFVRGVKTKSLPEQVKSMSKKPVKKPKKKGRAYEK